MAAVSAEEHARINRTILKQNRTHTGVTPSPWALTVRVRAELRHHSRFFLADLYKEQESKRGDLVADVKIESREDKLERILAESRGHVGKPVSATPSGDAPACLGEPSSLLVAVALRRPKVVNGGVEWNDLARATPHLLERLRASRSIPLFADPLASVRAPGDAANAHAATLLSRTPATSSQEERGEAGGGKGGTDTGDDDEVSSVASGEAPPLEVMWRVKPRYKVFPAKLSGPDCVNTLQACLGDDVLGAFGSSGFIFLYHAIIAHLELWVSDINMPNQSKSLGYLMLMLM